MTTPVVVVRIFAPLMRTGEALGCAGFADGAPEPGGSSDLPFSENEEYVDGAVRGVFVGSVWGGAVPSGV